MIYIFLLFFLMIIHLGVKDSPRKRLFVFIIVSIIACCGYMCGSDWRAYELHYNDLTEPFEFISMGILEPGIYVMMFFFGKLGLSYWGFSCLMKILCLLPIWITITRFSDKNYFYLALLFYFSFYGFELFVDCPFRNLCAIAICSISFINYKRGILYHSIIVILAFLFHSTSLIMIPFLFFMKKEIKSKYFIIIYCAVFLITLSGNLLDYIAKLPLLDTLFIGEKINRYAVAGHGEDSLVSNPFSLTELLRTGLFIWFILNRKYFTNSDNHRMIFNGAMMFFILAKFGAAVELFSRFSFFFATFYAVGFVHMAIGNVLNFKPISYSLLVTLLSIVLCSSAITADYRFIPYTNYIYYKAFKDSLPTYSERDSYNYKNSPYSYKNR